MDHPEGYPGAASIIERPEPRGALEKRPFKNTVLLHVDLRHDSKRQYTDAVPA
jgi:hypothetical protein